MKKVLAGLMVAAVVAAVAQAAETTSANAVGFINKDVENGSLVALTIPFVNMDSEDGLWDFDATQIAADAPTASTVYFWNGVAWAGYPKGRNGFKTGYKLKAGECFFFKPSGDMTVTMAGEVPDDESIDVMVTGAANLSAIGSPYPVDVAFDSSALASSSTTASTVYFWNGVAWAGYPKGRNGFKTGYVLQPGEGFFFKSTSGDDSKEWTAEKPYAFP